MRLRDERAQACPWGGGKASWRLFFCLVLCLYVYVYGGHIPFLCGNKRGLAAARGGFQVPLQTLLSTRLTSEGGQSYASTWHLGGGRAGSDSAEPVGRRLRQAWCPGGLCQLCLGDPVLSGIRPGFQPGKPQRLLLVLPSTRGQHLCEQTRRRVSRAVVRWGCSWHAAKPLPSLAPHSAPC